MKKENTLKKIRWIQNYIDAVYDFTFDKSSLPSNPFNAWKFYPLYFDLWLDKLHDAIFKLKKKKVAEEKIVAALPSVNSLRYILYTVINMASYCEYDHAKAKIIIDFFIHHLQLISKDENIFNESSNIIRNNSEVAALFRYLNPTSIKSEKERRTILKLCSVLMVYNHALYSDYSTGYGVSYDGPYRVEKNQELLVKDYPDLKSTALWPRLKRLPFRHIRVYAIYKNTHLKIRFITHYIIAKNRYQKKLIGYKVVIDGKIETDIGRIEHIIKICARTATGVYNAQKKMPLEKIKILFLKQQGYELKKIFSLAGLDWKPNKMMIRRISKKSVTKSAGNAFTPKNQKEYEEYIGATYLKRVYGLIHRQHIFRGVIANTGLAKGIARVIKTKADFKKFKNGNILVTEITDPSHISLLIKAGAIVTEKGGLTSHAAIIAREFDVPCLVGVKKITQVIKDGQIIKVNATKGHISLP